MRRSSLYLSISCLSSASLPQRPSQSTRAGMSREHILYQRTCSVLENIFCTREHILWQMENIFCTREHVLYLNVSSSRVPHIITSSHHHIITSSRVPHSTRAGMRERERARARESEREEGGGRERARVRERRKRKRGRASESDDFKVEHAVREGKRISCYTPSSEWTTDSVLEKHVLY
jgi:hypothetical protein